MAMRSAAAPVTRTGRAVASSIVHLYFPTPPPAQSQLPTNRAFPARIAPSRPPIRTPTARLPSSLGLADSLVEMEEHTIIEMLKKIKADAAKDLLRVNGRLKTMEEMLKKDLQPSDDMEEHTIIEMLKKFKVNAAKEFLRVDGRLKTLEEMLKKDLQPSDDKIERLLLPLGLISRICIVVCLGYLWSKSD